MEELLGSIWVVAGGPGIMTWGEWERYKVMDDGEIMTMLYDHRNIGTANKARVECQLAIHTR